MATRVNKSRTRVIVDHFSTFPHGGAGTAARRLHERLIDQGINSRFNYWKDEAGQRLGTSYRKLEFDQPKTWSLVQPVRQKLQRRRQRRICNAYDLHIADRPPHFELFTMPWTLEPTQFDFSRLQSRIVHLHWMAFFIDYPSFFASIPNTVPIVWSLHDMNPLTGGCHYSSGCSRFMVGCGSCPQVNASAPRDVSRRGFRSKQLALKKKKIHVVTPNHWLQELAQHSRIFPSSTQFHIIRLGLDPNVFKPIDQRLARQKLGLPQKPTLLAFGAEDLQNFRKGFHHLLAALRRLSAKSEIECVVFGSGKLPEHRDGLPKIHEFGFVDSEERQALLYSAADMFVLPSREDNQPQTGLEAMACGTPVIAFRAGGIPEYVIPGETGLMATLGNESEMARMISWMADNEAARQHMALRARRLIERRFTAEEQARRYLDLYEQLCDDMPESKPIGHRRAA